MEREFRGGCPHRIKRLARDERGYPVPFFAMEVHGKPDFRIADTDKWFRCVKESLCWVCGDKLGAYKTFPIGPMCAINRTTAEPPSHLDCARFSAQNCPFLSQPRMRRNEKDKPEGASMPGIGILRNPGVTLLWSTREYALFFVDGKPLIKVGNPTSVEWWAEGRKATRAEVIASIDSGLPLLEKYVLDDPEGLEDLRRRRVTVEALLPPEAA